MYVKKIELTNTIEPEDSSTNIEALFRHYNQTWCTKHSPK